MSAAILLLGVGVWSPAENLFFCGVTGGGSKGSFAAKVPLGGPPDAPTGLPPGERTHRADGPAPDRDGRLDPHQV